MIDKQNSGFSRAAVVIRHWCTIAGVMTILCIFACKNSTTPATHSGEAEQPVAQNQPADRMPAAPAPSDNRSGHPPIDTNSSASRANFEKPAVIPKTPFPYDPQSRSKEKPAGPPGFIRSTRVALLTEPKVGSSKVATLEKREEVSILSMSMENERGEKQSLPTWYKVQRKTKAKETGWVKASEIDSGGGG